MKYKEILLRITSNPCDKWIHFLHGKTDPCLSRMDAWLNTLKDVFVSEIPYAPYNRKNTSMPERENLWAEFEFHSLREEVLESDIEIKPPTKNFSQKIP